MSISIGMNDVRMMFAASAASNFPIISCVKTAESIKSSSHGMRLLYRSVTLSRGYGLSDGVIAAIFSMSSVASSRITSIASSTVTIPTSLFSPSTTGMTVKSYFANISATTAISSSVPTEITFSSIRSETTALALASTSVRKETRPISLRFAIT